MITKRFTCAEAITRTASLAKETLRSSTKGSWGVNVMFGTESEASDAIPIFEAFWMGSVNNFYIQMFLDLEKMMANSNHRCFIFSDKRSMILSFYCDKYNHTFNLHLYSVRAMCTRNLNLRTVFHFFWIISSNVLRPLISSFRFLEQQNTENQQKNKYFLDKKMPGFQS